MVSRLSKQATVVFYGCKKTLSLFFSYVIWRWTVLERGNGGLGNFMQVLYIIGLDSISLVPIC